MGRGAPRPENRRGAQFSQQQEGELAWWECQSTLWSLVPSFPGTSHLGVHDSLSSDSEAMLAGEVKAQWAEWVRFQPGGAVGTLNHGLSLLICSHSP